MQVFRKTPGQGGSEFSGQAWPPDQAAWAAGWTRVKWHLWAQSTPSTAHLVPSLNMSKSTPTWQVGKRRPRMLSQVLTATEYVEPQRPAGLGLGSFLTAGLVQRAGSPVLPLVMGEDETRSWWCWTNGSRVL
ncbi:hypothetical protein H1C71_001702 [Ictidomys tridecemlineatus]|nr:hypothetical protein H1C71_001702 [Ictidomys tridecemlineatus]